MSMKKTEAKKRTYIPWEEEEAKPKKEANKWVVWTGTNGKDGKWYYYKRGKGKVRVGRIRIGSNPVIYNNQGSWDVYHRQYPCIYISKDPIPAPPEN